VSAGERTSGQKKKESNPFLTAKGLCEWGDYFQLFCKNIYSKLWAALAAVYIGSGLVAPCGLFVNLGFLGPFLTVNRQMAKKKISGQHGSHPA